MTEPVSASERRDYPDMVTPTELRNLAEGLENCNHASEHLARLYHDAARLRSALENYAGKAPLDLNKASEIQRDLRAILGETHFHKASIGSDRCWLCGHDLRNHIHRRAA